MLETGRINLVPTPETEECAFCAARYTGCTTPDPAIGSRRRSERRGYARRRDLADQLARGPSRGVDSDRPAIRRPTPATS